MANQLNRPVFLVLVREFVVKCQWQVDLSSHEVYREKERRRIEWRFGAASLATTPAFNH